MHFDLGAILLHARCRRHPPAPSFDSKSQTHGIEAFAAEDGALLEDELLEAPERLLSSSIGFVVLSVC